MKKYILPLLCILAMINVHSQVPSISSTRFGNLKLGFSIDSINKYVDQKIQLPKLIDKNDYRYDTVHALYRDVPIKLMVTQFFNPDEQKLETELSGIYTESSNVATKSGIKAGQNKFDIIKKLDGSILYIRPEKELGKNISVVILYDEDNYTEIVFYFRGNILYAIECRNFGEDGC